MSDEEMRDGYKIMTAIISQILLLENDTVRNEYL
jgi:hypothetical protein